jgi:predicted transposase YdaD
MNCWRGPINKREAVMFFDILKIRGIEESSVYQGIFAKGEAKGLAEAEVKARRNILLRQGRRKWGEPDESVLARIAAIGDLGRLNLLSDRILDATTWDDLLASVDRMGEGLP